MCFSSTASFVSGAVLGAIGLASLKRVTDPKQYFFAAIPVLFSIQQVVEGFVWLSYNNGPSPEWQQSMIRAFLFFALVVWPIWIPLSVWKMETSLIHKRILFVFLTVGLVFGSVCLWFLIIHISGARIENHHVHYELNFPFRNEPIVPFLYVLATVVTLLISTVKWTPLLGGLIFLSYVITRYYYKDEVISVWCFFAALISAIIYRIVAYRAKIGESVLVSAHSEE